MKNMEKSRRQIFTSVFRLYWPVSSTFSFNLVSNIISLFGSTGKTMSSLIHKLILLAATLIRS